MSIFLWVGGYPGCLVAPRVILKIMTDFAILSLPRSGSHMLASALDSHPAIKCVGEYNTYPEKFPIGLRSGAIEGCIVQGYHISGNIAPGWLPKAKLILLNRPIPEILYSLYKGHAAGGNYSQYLKPTDRSEDIHYPIRERHWAYLEEMRDIVKQYVEGREHMTVSYQSMCKGSDARAIRWEVAHQLCDFLGVARQPLRPVTHKPS